VAIIFKSPSKLTAVAAKLLDPVEIYGNLEGSRLEALGRLFAQNVCIYAYPMHSASQPAATVKGRRGGGTGT